MAKTVLKGITWGHSRGITPLLAYSQRFSEIYKDVEVTWDKRSLQQFADFPIEQLTKQYDLLIIDHPWVGCAAATNCVLPLEQYLSKEYLADQLQHSVGYSHLSYNYNDHQWALAIDAATPAASYRADLFEKHKVQIPSTWKEVIELARMGKIAVPAIAIDLLMNFYMFCIANGSEPFLNEDEVTDARTGKAALETMNELYNLVDKKMFQYNPIAVAELMAATDDYWYCPFAYCYSNYSRHGYAKNILYYGDLVNFPSTGKLHSTIGGTGLAVSAYGSHKELALQFAEQIVSSTCQSTIYVEHGGQPGHRSAWVDEKANQLCNHFFTNLLPAMDDGYVRPRHHGYLHFQDHAGDIIQHYLLHGGREVEVLNNLNGLYKKSFVLN
jgi:multiple sugar transport system substrate-binding protein